MINAKVEFKYLHFCHDTLASAIRQHKFYLTEKLLKHLESIYNMFLQKNYCITQ